MEVKPQPPPQVLQLASGPDLHVIAGFGDSEVIYGQAAQVPLEKQAWDAVYRVPLSGGAAARLAAQVYGLKAARAAGGRGPVLLYLTPAAAGTPTLKTLGHLWRCQPGADPAEVVPADPPLVLQPLLLSPDNRYLISYGPNPAPSFFSIDLTDLDTGQSRRLDFATSITPPRWIGFDGGTPYVTFQNVNDMVPFAAYRVDVPGPVIPLPGRFIGTLADGRAALEGQNGAGLLALSLDAHGAMPETIGPGPVLDLSGFVRAGAAYYVSALFGQEGDFLRVAPGQAPVTLQGGVTDLWYAAPQGKVAYVADLPVNQGRGLRAVALPDGPSLLLYGGTVRSYRPVRNDGIIYNRDRGIGYYAPGMAQAAVISDDPMGGSAWQVSDQLLAVVEAPGGSLRLVDTQGKAQGDTLAQGVDLVDSIEGGGGAVLLYSVPKGSGAGIWRRPIP